MNPDPNWKIVTDALSAPVTKSAAAPASPEGDWGMVKQALAAAAKGALSAGKGVGKNIYGASRQAGVGRTSSALDAAKTGFGAAKQEFIKSPTAVTQLKTGLRRGGLAAGGAATYGVGNMRGQATGREAGMGEGYDAGVKHGVSTTNALNQEGGDVLGRLKALFMGRPSYDTQAIIDSLQGNRSNVINQLLGQSA